MLIEARTTIGIIAVFMGFGVLALMALAFYSWMTSNKSKKEKMMKIKYTERRVNYG